jgi:hypothetical protein
LSDYISLPIETDPEDILDDAYSHLQAVIPGWVPADGNLDVWLLQSISAIAAESRDVASDVPRSIFRWFGANLVKLPPVDASAATSQTTWTLIDNLGHTIPAGTLVGIPDATGEIIPFETREDVVVYPGTSATAAGAVGITAVTPGTESTNLGTGGSVIQLLDPLDFVNTVTLTATTSGGVDAESDEDYLNRLAAQLQLLSPRPILPNDFAVFARNVSGVWRATSIDGYNPNTGTFNNPRTITIAAVDENGNAVSTAVKNAIDADLQARREVNFLVFVTDPTYTTIAVTYRVQALSSYTIALVKSEVDASLAGYLNPGTWGIAEGDSRSWISRNIVRYLEIAQVINDVRGVDYIVSLTIGVQGGAMSTADVTLTGVAPLPRVGTLNGTVDPAA